MKKKNLYLHLLEKKIILVYVIKKNRRFIFIY